MLGSMHQGRGAALAGARPAAEAAITVASATKTIRMSLSSCCRPTLQRSPTGFISRHIDAVGRIYDDRDCPLLLDRIDPPAMMPQAGQQGAAARRTRGEA